MKELGIKEVREITFRSMLELLCQLHGRPAEDAQNVVCDFDLDCSSAEEYSQKIESLISVLIKAEP